MLRRSIMLSSLPRLLLLILLGPTGIFLMMSVGMAMAHRTRKGEHYPWDASHDD